MEDSEYKKSCTRDDELMPHGSEVDDDEETLLCVDGKWVNMDDLISVGC